MLPSSGSVGGTTRELKPTVTNNHAVRKRYRSPGEVLKHGAHARGKTESTPELKVIAAFSGRSELIRNGKSIALARRVIHPTMYGHSALLALVGGTELAGTGVTAVVKTVTDFSPLPPTGR